jgi:NAD(P)H-hydrate epimerase
MKRVISSEQARRQDAEYSGDLGPVMERAGYAVAGAAARLGAGYGSRVVVLAGAGNNGGDGYVAARHLARRGALVTVLALGEPQTELAVAAAAVWRRRGGVVRQLEEPIAADLVIDAVFGVGFRGDLPAAVAAWEDHPAKVIAVDVPSGLNATTGEVAKGTIPAAVTVALSHYKLGHFLGMGPDVCGRLELAELGLPPAEETLRLCEASDAPRPDRRRSAHKWSAGTVAVIGGSSGMAGAPVLAAKAALRFGAGAVATFVPGALAAELNAAHPEVMTRGVGDGVNWEGVDPVAVSAATERFDVLVVGPGLGDGCEDFVAGLLDSVPQPVVLDADGLNAVSVDMIGALRSRGLEAPTAARSAAYWHGEAGATVAAASSVTAELLAEEVRRFAF